MHPERFDALVADGMSESELARRRLLRVSPDFMVVALGLQVPRFPGAPLDPPLRSRFQARAPGAAAAVRKEQLGALAPHAAAGLHAAVDALDALDARHALSAGAVAPGGGEPLPCVPRAALLSLGRLQALFLAAPLAELLPRLLPHATTSAEIRALLDHFGLQQSASESGGGGGGAAGYSLAHVSGVRRTGPSTALRSRRCRRRSSWAMRLSSDDQRGGVAVSTLTRLSARAGPRRGHGRVFGRSKGLRQDDGRRALRRRARVRAAHDALLPRHVGT